MRRFVLLVAGLLVGLFASGVISALWLELPRDSDWSVARDFQMVDPFASLADERGQPTRAPWPTFACCLP